jgi:endonuclease YncB( thermonuclease family)
LSDGRSLNQKLVRAGYAWWFRRYSADPLLARLEADARLTRRGLWADPRPRRLGTTVASAARAGGPGGGAAELPERLAVDLRTWTQAAS